MSFRIAQNRCTTLAYAYLDMECIGSWCIVYKSIVSGNTVEPTVSPFSDHTSDKTELARRSSPATLAKSDTGIRLRDGRTMTP